MLYNILIKEVAEIHMKPNCKFTINSIFVALPIILSIIIIMFFLPACDNAKPIKIGFVGGLTGKYYDLGVSGRNGVVFALEEINKKGGIRGRKVELIIKDDMQDVKVLEKSVSELLKEGAVAIIGPFTSGMSLIALPLINEGKIVMISPTATSSKLAEKDDHFIKINSNISVFSEPLADYASNKKGLKNISAIYDLHNRAYSEEFLATFKSRFQKNGKRVISETGFAHSEKISYLKLSHELLKNNPDGILIIANTFDTSMICQQIRKVNPRIPIFSSPWAMTTDITSLGGKSVEGLIFGHSYFPDIDIPLFKEFKMNYEKRFGREPDFVSVKGYDAANMLFMVLAEIQNSKNLKEAIIKKQRFKGVAGDLEINEYGDITEKGFIVIINDGRFVRLH